MPLPTRFKLHVCHHCGRIVARQPCYSTGKGSVRHKCPHGIWCSSASHYTATNNMSSSCKICRYSITLAESHNLRPFAEARAEFERMRREGKV